MPLRVILNQPLKNSPIMKLVKYSDLEGAVDGLRKRGFVYNFKLTSEGLKCLATKDVFQPSSLKINEFHRFHTYDENAESSLIFVVTSSDGMRGFVLSNYENDVDMELIEFMQKVRITNAKAHMPSAN